MVKLRGFLFAVLLCFPVLFLSACNSTSQLNTLNDGYYAAEATDFDEYGWKEYVSIYVSAGKIITVEYDAFDACGFVKSWDINYMRTMNCVSGTYPNEYARAYSISLLNWQDPDDVDVVTGATNSHAKFLMLANAAIEKAIAGDKQVAYIDFSDESAVEEHAE